jgi:hypothetical protein
MQAIHITHYISQSIIHVIPLILINKYLGMQYIHLINFLKPYN